MTTEPKLPPPPFEQFRPIPGWGEKYEISNHGRLRKRLKRPTHRLAPPAYAYLDGSPQTSGHIRVQLTHDGKRLQTHIHRLVAEAFLGTPPTPQHIVLHWDDNPANNHLANLRWGTHKDNTGDAVRNGKKPAYILAKEKTQCPRGHALKGPNLSPAHLKRGARTCLACHQVATGAWGQRTRRTTGTGPTKHPEYQARTDRAYAAILKNAI